MGRVVVELQYDIFGPDLADVSSMDLMNPDGELVLSITPPALHLAQHVNPMDTTLQTTNGSNSFGRPGTAEPDATMMASIDDIKFSSIMWDGVSSISTEMEFFELTNVGTEAAMLNGWTVKRIASDGTSFESTITNLQIGASSSVKLSNDVAALEY